MCRWTLQGRWAPPEHPRDTSHAFSARYLRLPVRPVSLEQLLHKVGHIPALSVRSHGLQIHSIPWPPLTIEPPSCSTSGAWGGSIQHLLRSSERTATFILWKGQLGLLDRGKFFSKQTPQGKSHPRGRGAAVGPQACPLPSGVLHWAFDLGRHIRCPTANV